jgi:cytochrome P450
MTPDAVRTGVHVVDLDITSPQFHADPYRQLDALRAQGEVVHLKKSNAWLLLGYEQVRAALFDERLSADMAYLDHQTVKARHGRKTPLQWFTEDPLLRGDPNQLTALRRCLSQVLSPLAASAFEGRIRSAIDGVLCRLHNEATIDIYEDFGLPVATEVLFALFDIPGDELVAFNRYSRSFVKIMAPGRTPLEAAQINNAIRSFRRYVDDLLNSTAPGADGLVPQLLSARESASESISEDDIAKLLITLMAVGTQSVASAVTTSLVTYFHDPEARAMYPTEGGDRWPWVLESLRINLFVLFLVRFAATPLEFGDATIQPGELVWLSPAAAHRDPQVFVEPTRFDARRDLTAAIPFGLGPHYCSGAALAKAEVTAAVEGFVDSFPSASADTTDITWATDLFSRRPMGATVDLRGLHGRRAASASRSE